MAVLPPPCGYRHGGGGDVVVGLFLAVNTKMHFSAQKFYVLKYKTMRLDESYDKILID